MENKNKKQKQKQIRNDELSTNKRGNIKKTFFPYWFDIKKLFSTIVQIGLIDEIVVWIFSFCNFDAAPHSACVHNC